MSFIPSAVSGALKPVTSNITFTPAPEDVSTSLITEVVWLKTPPNSQPSLLVRVMNRVQDHEHLYLVHRPSATFIWSTTLIRESQTPDGAWWDRLQTIKPTANGGWVETTERDGYYHIMYYSSPAEKGRWLTSGQWEVTEIVSIALGRVWYLSTQVGSTQRHFYRFVETSFDSISAFFKQYEIAFLWRQPFRNSYTHLTLTSRRTLSWPGPT